MVNLLRYRERQPHPIHRLCFWEYFPYSRIHEISAPKITCKPLVYRRIFPIAGFMKSQPNDFAVYIGPKIHEMSYREKQP